MFKYCIVQFVQIVSCVHCYFTGTYEYSYLWLIIQRKPKNNNRFFSFFFTYDHWPNDSQVFFHYFGNEKKINMQERITPLLFWGSGMWKMPFCFHSCSLGAASTLGLAFTAMIAGRDWPYYPLTVDNEGDKGRVYQEMATHSFSLLQRQRPRSASKNWSCKKRLTLSS